MATTARALIAITSVVLLLTPLGAGTRRPVPFLERVEQALAGSKTLDSAFVGVSVVRLSDGRTLFQRNADHLFTPASNTKLFTTALALSRLGPDYRFTTSIMAERPVDVNGVFAGDLIFVGRGDPTLSGRLYPYAVEDGTPNDPLSAVEEMADQLAKLGLKSVRGNVAGDDTRYPWEPYPQGWSAADGFYGYGAPVSALVVNDNEFDLTVTPGDSEGDLAQIELSPGFEYFSIDNRVRTLASGPAKIHLEGRPGTPQLRIWGGLLIGKEYKTSVAVSDPALFAAAALRDALIRRGVEVRGNAVARHRFLDEVEDPESGTAIPEAAGTELVRRISPPLSQVVEVVDKVSQNLHAEVLLREVGAAKRSMGTVQAGEAEMKDFLDGIGIADDAYRFGDGSGLSRMNLVTPHAITSLLTYMYGTKLRDLWISVLPVGGQDGTLRNRFKRHPEASAVHAKTGSLGHVRALSGYVESKEYGTLAFSLMVNSYLANDSDVAKFLDNIGVKLIH